MRISTPRLLADFVCLADACPDTCCAAWEIELDPKSAERYAKDPTLRALLSDDGVTLRQSACGACPHLTENQLCRAYAERPAVCSEYPAYHRDLGSRREIGLSFSCPALLELILREREPLSYEEREDPSVCPDTYSEIDAELLPQILSARAASLSIAADPALSLFERLRGVLLLSGAIDRSVRRRRYAALSLPKEPLSLPSPKHSQKRERRLLSRLLSVCLSFEYLDASHRALFLSAKRLVEGKDGPERLSAFRAHMAERTHEYEKWLSQSLRQSYGAAAETRDPLLRAKTTVAETLLLLSLGASRYAETGNFTVEDQAELFRIFSREYEHSTENPLILRRKLRHPAFSLRNMLAAL